MALNREKIEKGEIRKFFAPTKSKVHKWMKNQMNRFIRRKSKHINEDDPTSIKRSYKGWEY